MKLLTTFICVLLLTTGCSLSREDKSQGVSKSMRLFADSQNASDGDVDACGVEGGDGSSCADCNDVPNGKAVLDICDVCDGDGSTCLDCKGVAFGGATLDDCGVCDGDSTTCGLARVVNRQVFYNRSTSLFFGDGSGNPGNAIDPTKIALLPNQDAGTANYTNYNRGINGLVVDVEGVAGYFSHSDFEFKTWNGMSGNGFVPLSSPATITEIPHGGVNLTKRIKIEFADSAVKNTWLRVRVKATAANSLKTDDVFYFGNAIGDVYVGNIATPPGTPITIRVNATDTSQVRQHQSTPMNSVGISNIYDFNKDGRVNATDTSTVRQNQNPAFMQMFRAPNEVLTANNAFLDECGVVNGDGSSCEDCRGVSNGGVDNDECGVCGGDNSSCKDCLGVPNGDAEVDDCGVCAGDGESCSPDPTPTPTPSPSPSPSPTVSPSPSPTVSPTPSPTVSPSPSPTPTDPGTIPLTPADCGRETRSMMGPDGRPSSIIKGNWVPPAPGKVCCPWGTLYSGNFWEFTLPGHSTTENECCAKQSMRNTYFDTLIYEARNWYFYYGQNNPLAVLTEASDFGVVLDQGKLCCATTPSIKTTLEALSSIKHVPIQGGNKGANLNEWNGNFPTQRVPYPVPNVKQMCLPGCTRATQNETLNGSADPRYFTFAQACCRVSCTGDDSKDFGFTNIRGGSSCTPSSGVNGNDKGVCLPCPECEYKKPALPTVLTPPCTNDELMYERLGGPNGPLPLCEKETAPSCPVPQ